MYILDVGLDYRPSSFYVNHYITSFKSVKIKMLKMFPLFKAKMKTNSKFTNTGFIYYLLIAVQYKLL